MKILIIKHLFMFSLLLLFSNCSVNQAGMVSAALLSILAESDKDSDSEEKEEVKLKSSGFYTLQQDLGSLEDFEPQKEKKTVSFKKLGSKYVSSRILLESLGLKTEFEILSDSDLDFEIYQGTLPLISLSDKQKRIQKLSGSKDFKVTKKGKEWTLEYFKQENYSLFLVSDSKNTVTIKKIFEDIESFPDDSKVKENLVEITENVKKFSATFDEEYTRNLISGNFFYRGPQLTFNVKKGDRVFAYSSNSEIRSNWTNYFNSLLWYKGSVAFKIREEHLGCQNYSCRNWPARFSDYFPDTIFATTGSYSRRLYLSLENKVESVDYQAVKISPYIPKAGTVLTPINENFKSIDYILDDRNTIFKTWTSNQWTLTGVKKGTILKIQMHPTKSYREIVIEMDYKDPHKYSILAQATFYTGTERLTAENASDRFVPHLKVIDASKYKFEKNYTFDDTYQEGYSKITFNKTGDFSIVFTNYNKEQLTNHKVKVE